MRGSLNGILALVSLVIAAFTFYQYIRSNDEKLYLVLAIVFALAFIGLGGYFLSGRVNRNEDIHITE